MSQSRVDNGCHLPLPPDDRYWNNVYAQLNWDEEIEAHAQVRRNERNEKLEPLLRIFLASIITAVVLVAAPSVLVPLAITAIAITVTLVAAGISGYYLYQFFNQ